jgi:hypothetical protein
MIGHKRKVAAFSSVKNVGLACYAGGGSNLRNQER